MFKKDQLRLRILKNFSKECENIYNEKDGDLNNKLVLSR